MTPTTKLQSSVLLDDGTFLVCVDINAPNTQSSGFLLKRCLASPYAPAGTECVGSFARGEGAWYSEINKQYTAEQGQAVQSLGNSPSRLSAICNLWRHRHLASVHAS